MLLDPQEVRLEIEKLSNELCDMSNRYQIADKDLENCRLIYNNKLKESEELKENNKSLHQQLIKYKKQNELLKELLREVL